VEVSNVFKSIYINLLMKEIILENPINGEKLFITPEKDMEIN
jgi:hypothetical protein